MKEEKEERKYPGVIEDEEKGKRRRRKRKREKGDRKRV